MALSKKEQMILEVLADARREGVQELYGKEIVSRSNGRVSYNALYVQLGKLEEEGYISSRSDELPPVPRRLYKLTDKGHRARNEEEDRVGLLPGLISPA